jgi:mannose-1-phosphate guanylyltransferase/mannose-6-phosphate isomerase
VIIPVLLAGGSGTRLWPLSRESFPKQFLRLTGKHSLLQETVLRSRNVGSIAAPIVVCGEEHRFLVAEQLREIAVSGASIVLEPMGRNTAPAVAVAALQAQALHGADALMLVMAADHAVADGPAFTRAVEDAADVAAQGYLTTFGVKPTRPETGYGYLKRGAPIGSKAFRVGQFVEKPPLDRAEMFLAEGGYDWNGGLFMFPVGLLLEELRRFEPEMLELCAEALEEARKDLDFVRLDKDAFARLRSDSIDYAVMEKTDRAALVPLDCGWDDVGSWSFLGTQGCDASGNYTRGDVITSDTRDSLIHAESRLVATVGIDNAVVVETSDAVLVTTRDRVQDVKKMVQHLKSAGRSEAQYHAKVLRPWGSYETIALGGRFQVKRIIVKPGEKLSLQMHHHRAEHWIVVQGTARVTCNDKVFLLSEDQSTYIPLGNTHRLDNPGKVPLELIEVQSGSYLGEDDIVRFEDIYGRTPETVAIK